VEDRRPSSQLKGEVTAIVFISVHVRSLTSIRPDERDL
jgi:hypothetical protein